MMASCALLALVPPLGSSPLHRAQFTGALLSGQDPGEFEYVVQEMMDSQQWQACSIN